MRIILQQLPPEPLPSQITLPQPQPRKSTGLVATLKLDTLPET